MRNGYVVTKINLYGYVIYLLYKYAASSAQCVNAQITRKARTQTANPAQFTTLLDKQW